MTGNAHAQIALADIDAAFAQFLHELGVPFQRASGERQDLRAMRWIEVGADIDR